MKVASQAQFTPLPEALCIIISHLNKHNSPASFEEILGQLKRKYTGVHQPAEEVVYEALGTLLKERKIYHTGKGYHIITPELFAHLNHLNGCATLQDQRTSVYIPVSPPLVSEMCSIACQTEEVPQNTDTPSCKDEDVTKKNKCQRSNSMKNLNKSKKGTADVLRRTASMRSHHGRPPSLNDVDVMNSGIPHKYKAGGDKTSFLSKLFGSGRSKKKLSTMAEQEGDHADTLSATGSKPVVQHATFSGQFPPPDLQCYEVQSRPATLIPTPPHHGHTKHPNSLSKRSSLSQSQTRPVMVDAEAQSDVCRYDEEIKTKFVRKSKTLPENIQGFIESIENPTQQNFSSHSSCSRCSSVENDRNLLHVMDSKVKRRSVVMEDKINDKYKSLGESRCPKSHDKGQTVEANKHTNNFSCHVKNSTSPKAEAIYEDIKEYLRTPSNQCGRHRDETTLEKSTVKTTAPGECSQPDIIPYTARNFKNSSHKNKIYKKYKEKYNTVENSSGTKDTCLEENDRFERRGDIFKSRDSGVNCVGLSANQMTGNTKGVVLSPEIGPLLLASQHNCMDSHPNVQQTLSPEPSGPGNRAYHVIPEDEVSFQMYHRNTSVHEDSGFNSTKGNFSFCSPKSNQPNSRSVKKQQTPNQNWRHSFTDKKSLKERNNSNYLGIKLDKMSRNSISYQETDLDSPQLD